MRLRGEHHHCRDGAGTGEHRHREWRERRVVLDLTLHDLWSTLLRASLRMQHVHGDEPEDQAAGDAERGQRDTEQLKDERASDSPIAIACLRLFTLPPCPLLPRLSVPCLRRRIALSTRLLAAFPYFRPPDLRPRFFAAM